jgi:hypothetical protein
LLLAASLGGSALPVAAAPCPPAAAGVIDGLYRWVETWQRANAALNLASQCHRFTPALNGQIQRALALTPADGRFVDFNIFNGTQVSTFGARVLGCAPGNGNGKLNCRFYEEELARLQVELVKMPYWIRSVGFRLIVVFEGRDAAGKGRTIKRVTEPLNPRGCSVVALGTPSDRERSQWYFQR